jgi:hypothetical protein
VRAIDAWKCTLRRSLICISFALSLTRTRRAEPLRAQLVQLAPVLDALEGHAAESVQAAAQRTRAALRRSLPRAAWDMLAKLIGPLATKLF